jgi:hypothetical protein
MFNKKAKHEERVIPSMNGYYAASAHKAAGRDGIELSIHTGPFDSIEQMMEQNIGGAIIHITLVGSIRSGPKYFVPIESE